jgi:hypothetical protein
MFQGTTTKLSENVIASADTIYPKSDFVRLTGAVQINTIRPSYGGGFSGVLFLVSTSGLVLGTSGNINVGATLTANRLYVLVYSKLSAKWFIAAAP